MAAVRVVLEVLYQNLKCLWAFLLEHPFDFEGQCRSPTRIA
jgi:hypothetical protein